MSGCVLKGGVAGRVALPNDGRPPVKEVIDAFQFRERHKREVNHVDLVGQVGWMKGVVGGPRDGASAEDVERKASGEPKRDQLGAGEAGLIE